MKRIYALLRRKPLGNSIDDVKSRLIFIFSVIALSSSFLVFFSFSIHLIVNEDRQIERHLKSFESIAVDHYTLAKEEKAELGPYVKVYYSVAALSDGIRAEMPYEEGAVTIVDRISENGFMVFYRPFVNKDGDTIPLYLSIGTRSVNFGDDSWDTLMLVSLGLMVFLIAFLRIALRRVFDGLMAPVTELGEQLRKGKTGEFVVAAHSVDELKQLNTHLNSYKKMKERLVKQEMMFAKYASHELKTPIAIVLGAANLQGMKDDSEFQAKQRERIVTAATNMQATVEILLNIVKQENVNCITKLYPVTEQDIGSHKYQDELQQGVELSVDITQPCEINLPPAVLAMILKNLINNAARFTTQGSIQVSVSADTISVVDSGCGLQHGNDSEHGLGLLIVNRLCTSYGWSFSLTDNVQAGCSAKLSINLAQN